ncbi:MAG: hypothetical protein HQM08_27425 [Candidatus Riflebacteria bacterium]|nr:hypothetical protein [Candidatus Riflebacteria bacterium]
MSGNPKKSLAQIEKELAKLIEEAQKRRAEVEANKREKTAELERNKRVEELKNDVLAEFSNFQKDVDSYMNKLCEDDIEEIKSSVDLLEKEIFLATNEELIREAKKKIPVLIEKLRLAVHRKRRADEFKKRLLAIEHISFQLAELETRLNEIEKETGGKFDCPGVQEILKFFDQTRSAIERNQSEIAEEILSKAELALERHEKLVADQLKQFRDMQEKCQIAIGEINGLIKSLKSDELISKWHKNSIEKLEREYHKTKENTDSGEFQPVFELLEEAKRRVIKMTEEANLAQFKADQRTYIAESIAKTLQEIGFKVEVVLEEHPGHPSTALIMHAISASGKSIDVSVPMDGEVWYSVGGFPMTSEIKIDGAAANSCDQAQSVIEEMHKKLSSAFKIKMGTLKWDGKDPNRRLKGADDLPSGGKKRSDGA